MDWFDVSFTDAGTLKVFVDPAVMNAVLPILGTLFLGLMLRFFYPKIKNHFGKHRTTYKRGVISTAIIGILMLTWTGVQNNERNNNARYFTHVPAEWNSFLQSVDEIRNEDVRYNAVTAFVASNPPALSHAGLDLVLKRIDIEFTSDGNAFLPNRGELWNSLMALADVDADVNPTRIVVWNDKYGYVYEDAGDLIDYETGEPVVETEGDNNFTELVNGKNLKTVFDMVRENPELAVKLTEALTAGQ